MKQVFKTIGSIAMSAILIMAASCAKENLSEETQNTYSAKGELRHVSVSTVMPTANNNDKAYVDGNRYVQWVEGDQMNINGTYLSAEEVRGTNHDTATFKGDVYSLPVGTNEIYWCVYPANKMGKYTDNNAIPSAIATNGNTLQVTFPTTYTYTDAQLNQHLTGLNLMVGRATVAKGAELKRVAMKNIGSIIKINMKAADGKFPASNTKNVKKVILTSCDGYIAGTYNVSTSYGVTAVSGQTNQVTVTFSNAVDISTQKSVCVMLPPTLKTNCLNITLVNTDGKIYHLSSTSATLARNTYYTANMTSVDFSTEAYNNNLNNTDYKFSTSGTNKVIFSPGNLQWSATNGGSTATTHTTNEGSAAGTFRFAPNQWDYVGTSCQYGTVYNTLGVKSKNEDISSTNKGWIDLFGWATSGYKSKNPWATSTTNTWYGPAANLTGDVNKYYDWGRYNQIFNPQTNATNGVGNWRLLTGDEIDYLLETRATGKTINSTANARYTMATIRTDVNGPSGNVHGLILFPDNYNGGNPTGVTWGKINTYTNWTTKCTAAGWKSLESHGCVFIPASGFRQGNTTYSVGANQSATHPYQCYVWSSTINSSNTEYAYHLLVNKSTVKKAEGPQRSNGYGVRLVRNSN